MAELADALDSKSGAFGRVGSTPTLGIFLTSLTSGVFCEYVTPSSVSGGLTYGGPVRYAPGHVAFARNDPHSGYFFNFTYEWSFFVSAQCPLLFLGDSPTVVRFAARPVMSLSLGTTPTLGIFLTPLTSGVFL